MGNRTAIRGWHNCPETVRGLVKEFVALLKSVEGDDLVGVYLHGSLAMGCFNPVSSDVDMLAVVNHGLSIHQKNSIVSYLIGNDIAAKSIEMSILLDRCLKPFVYPTPFELHYSPDWYDRYKNEQVDFAKQNYDEDLAAHIVVTRQRGICLLGKAAVDAFPEIPRGIYVKSLIADVRWIFERPLRNPVYSVLNLCRILAFLSEDSVLSKKEGGEWAMHALPEEHSSIIAQALAAYAGANEQAEMNLDSLNNFLAYFRTQTVSSAELEGGLAWTSR